MRVGVVMEAFADWPVADAMDWLTANAPEVTDLEIVARGYGPTGHCDRDALLDDDDLRKRWLADAARGRRPLGRCPPRSVTFQSAGFREPSAVGRDGLTPAPRSRYVATRLEHSRTRDGGTWYERGGTGHACRRCRRDARAGTRASRSTLAAAAGGGPFRSRTPWAREPVKSVRDRGGGRTCAPIAGTSASTPGEQAAMVPVGRAGRPSSLNAWPRIGAGL
jgi:hypothetical protein